jgi:PIN domain nuclease of toxin-antitoxin system
MRLLLDTHILLWWIGDDPALSRTACALIASPDNTIFISPVSTWEIWIKKSLGKLELPSEFEEVLLKEEFEHLPLTVAHTRAVAELPWHHRDPFDRMLIAQAQAADLTLLTADDALTPYGSFVKRV